MLEKKKIPDSVKYCKLIDWNANRRGKFNKQKRITVMEEIILKWKKTPGPMTYKTEGKKWALNKTLSQEPKNGYAGDIEAWAKEIPSVGKYNLLKSYSAIEKHVFGAWIGPR